MRHTRRRVPQLESLTALHSSKEEPIEIAAFLPLPEADPLVHEDNAAAAAAEKKKKKKKKEEEKEAYLAVASLTHPHDLQQVGSFEQQSQEKGSPSTLSWLMRMRKKKKRRRRIFSI
jgi:hypothetical protein